MLFFKAARIRDKDRERKIKRESAQSYIISILLMGGAHRWNIATRSINGMVWLHFPPFRGGEGAGSFRHSIRILPATTNASRGGEGISCLYLIYVHYKANLTDMHFVQ
jgi:hypothetical protein